MSRVRRITLVQRIGYESLRPFARLLSAILFRIDVFGRHHIPKDGGVLVCANHQSLIDPVLVGLCCNRRLNYLARRTLFDHRALGALIHFLDTIPLDRDGLGVEGLKETIRRLKAREMVLIFPEGTRSRDGELRTLKPGLCAVAKRAGAALLPVGIDGAHRAWPIGARFPRPARIAIDFGAPIRAEDAVEPSAENLLAELESRMRACHARARAAISRSG
ncbi:MAG: 1-acyl-sn-glycerol-3-phosphate acyltransferase [Planctomycetes bacterium]|nr:1-acyl-sn-glycerol-3-phosphate acyltransferase [Planctomycetota bacterium]